MPKLTTRILTQFGRIPPFNHPGVETAHDPLYSRRGMDLQLPDLELTIVFSIHDPHAGRLGIFVWRNRGREPNHSDKVLFALHL